MATISTIRSMAPAIIVSLLPKSAGSIARIGDDRYAPKSVRRATVVRESATLGQVAFYAAVIDRSFKGLKNHADHMVQRGERNLFTRAMEKLGGNEKLFLAGLAFTANISAEMISRKVAPRNVWKKPEDKDKAGKSPEKVVNAAPIAATLLGAGKGQPIPVEIEICEIVPPAHRAKNGLKFEAAAKPQPVPFTSHPMLPQAFPRISSQTFPRSFPKVNPFQGRVSSPPVSRPDFSV